MSSKLEKAGKLDKGAGIANYRSAVDAVSPGTLCGGLHVRRRKVFGLMLISKHQCSRQLSHLGG